MGTSSKRSVHRRLGDGTQKGTPLTARVIWNQPQASDRQYERVPVSPAGILLFRVCHGDPTSALPRLSAPWQGGVGEGAGGPCWTRQGREPAGQGLLTSCARGRVPRPPLARRGGGTAPLGGRCELQLTPPPGQDTRGAGTHPGRTRCIWSDFNSSRQAGGSSPPTPSRSGHNVAPSARLPVARSDATSAPWLAALGLVEGDTSAAAWFPAHGRANGRVGCAGCPR